METQTSTDYRQLEGIIDFVRENFRSRPEAEEVSDRMMMGRSRFEQLFFDWAGTDANRFLRYIGAEHVQKILEENGTPPRQGTTRLHAQFVNIEGMAPEEYKNGGSGLRIHYSFADSPFGPLLVASTPKGICYLGFEGHRERAFYDLTAKFPMAKFQQTSDGLQENALSIFRKDRGDLRGIKLHLKGTDFQMNVWNSLLQIPFGRLASYRNIAERIGQPTASRAVGTAIGSNPVAFLIPCHRVVRTTGISGGYRWGTTRKTAIIAWEQARADGGFEYSETTV